MSFEHMEVNTYFLHSHVCNPLKQYWEESYIFIYLFTYLSITHITQQFSQNLSILCYNKLNTIKTRSRIIHFKKLSQVL